MGQRREEEEETQNRENRRAEEKENVRVLYSPIPSLQNPSSHPPWLPWLWACHQHGSVSVPGGWPRLQSGPPWAGPAALLEQRRDCFLAAFYSTECPPPGAGPGTGHALSVIGRTESMTQLEPAGARTRVYVQMDCVGLEVSVMWTLICKALSVLGFMVGLGS